MAQTRLPCGLGAVFNLWSFPPRSCGHFPPGSERLILMKKQSLIETREYTGAGECHVTLTDENTGEVVYDFWNKQTQNKPGRPSTGKSCDFIKIYRTNMIDIAKNKKLDFTEAGLLCLLIPLCGWQTPYLVHPDTKENMSCSEIARFLGKDRKHVSNILDCLCKKGIISKLSRGEGIPCHYMMNTNLAFFGNTINDTNHVEIFKDCAYKAPVKVKYRKTPEKQK